MSGAPKQGQSDSELKTARTLNTVATIGAGHALYATVPEARRAAVRERGIKSLPAKTQPKARRALDLLKKPEHGAKLGTAGKVVAGGWLGLHGAELAGDVMARRSINAQLDQKRNAVNKADFRMVDVAKGDTRMNGRGKNLSKTKWCDDCGMPDNKCTCAHMSKADKKRDYTGVIAAPVGAGFAGSAALRHRRVAEVERAFADVPGGRFVRPFVSPEINAAKKVRNVHGAVGAGLLGAVAYERARNKRKANVEKGERWDGYKELMSGRMGMLAGEPGASEKAGNGYKRVWDQKAAAKANAARKGKNAKSVGRLVALHKAQRRFDAEADRQRRIGTYAGAGVIGGGALGVEAARQLKREGAKVVMPKGRKGILMATGAAAAGGMGAGMYKHGLSVRNQPYN